MALTSLSWETRLASKIQLDSVQIRLAFFLQYFGYLLLTLQMAFMDVCRISTQDFSILESQKFLSMNRYTSPSLKMNQLDFYLLNEQNPKWSPKPISLWYWEFRFDHQPVNVWFHHHIVSGLGNLILFLDIVSQTIKMFSFFLIWNISFKLKSPNRSSEVRREKGK